PYFLKIRKEISNPAGFLIPRFLQDHDIVQALAPLRTEKKELWIPLEDFFFILYPFVSGKEAMEIGMSDSQWKELGSTLKRIHSTQLPLELSQNVKRETFNPKWANLANELYKQIHTRNYDDPCQKDLATFWKSKAETIQMILERTEKIGKS